MPYQAGPGTIIVCARALLRNRVALQKRLAETQSNLKASNLHLDRYANVLYHNNSILESFPKSWTCACLLTIPRSGTWYTSYLFEYFYQSLAHISRDAWEPAFRLFPELTLAKLHAHSICPGFIEFYHGKLRPEWDTLEFKIPGINSGYLLLQQNQKLFSPLQNPQARIIHLYRNPLDQAISICRHLKHHLLANEVGDVDDLFGFIRNVNLESYIKIHFTFEKMREAFPANILMIPYEEMIACPEATFSRMLNFYGISLKSEMAQAALKRAISLASIDNMKALENKSGESLGKDQACLTERHIRSGSVGQWKDRLTSSELGYINDRLAKFEIRLETFDIGRPRALAS